MGPAVTDVNHAIILLEQILPYILVNQRDYSHGEIGSHLSWVLD